MINNYVKIKTTAKHSLAIIDTSSSYAIEAWDLQTDERRTLDDIPYAGINDRIAARAMAYGTLDSAANLSRQGAL